MTRWQKVAMLFLFIGAFASSFFFFTLKTSALTDPPTEYTATGHGAWNWPELIRTNESGHGGSWCSGSCAPLPVTHFDPEDSSYVIYHRPSDSWQVPHTLFGKTVTLTTWRVAVAPQGRTLILKKDSNGNYVITVDSGNFQIFQLLDYHGESVQPSGGGGRQYGGVGSVAPPFNVSSVVDMDYIYVARNVIYHPTWDAGVFNSFAEYGADPGQSCSAIDIGCWITKAWSGVSNTISSVGKAIVSTIASLFMPDTAKIQADFNDFKSFLDAKLGFLTYPFTFLADVFDAFTGPSDGTCTTSGCVKNFGGFLGGTFFVDFAVLAQEMPSLWDILRALVIGLTILEVIIMIRRKVMGVMHK